MKRVSFAIALLLFSSFQTTESAAQERNLINFQNMVKAVTGRSAWDYNNYGKWCGRGGSGEPVDGIDGCCRDHDRCYYILNRSQCKGMLLMGVYLMPYKWEIENGTVICDSDQSECRRVLCGCDKVASECFARNEYHEEYKHGWFGR